MHLRGINAVLNKPDDAGAEGSEGSSVVQVPASGVVAPAPSTSDGTAAAAAADGTAASGQSQTGAAASSEAPKTDWRDARIAELTAKLNRERAAKAAPPPKDEGESEADFEARVERLATAKAAQAEWDRQCNAVAAQGRTEFSEEGFNERLGKILTVVDHQDAGEREAYNGVLQAAIETGAAHKILFSLGDNPGEVRRLMGLSPTKRAVEIAQLASKLVAGAAAEPSSAPKPITPIAGGSGKHYEGIAPDNPEHGTKLPKSDWFARRQKQVEERGLQ